MKTKTPKTPTIPSENHQAVSLQEKFAQGRDALKASLVERDDEVDLVLTALVAQEHCLLVGPPGTAKSKTLDGLMSWMQGDRFSILLTKFTTPEEVFGPISVQGLKADQYRRITAGRLPEAHLGYVDEVFKASSAILNTLLRVLNERTYDNGDGVARPVPLKLCVAASNEWPDDSNGGKELGALFDRFLFRKKVRPVSKNAGRRALLKRAVARDLGAPSFPSPITPQDVDQAHQEAMALPLSNGCRKDFWRLLEELDKEGISPSDRRLVKAVGAVRAAAWLDGAAEVQTQHLEVLSHVLWDDPAEQPEKCAKVVGRIANPTGFRVNELLIEAEVVFSMAKDKVQATQAVPKLQEIGSTLEALGTSDPRVAKASQHVRSLVKSVYNTVIGMKGDEE